MIEFDRPGIDFHHRGFGIVAIIPDQPATGENDVDLILVARDGIYQRGEFDLTDPIDAETAVSAVDVHVDRLQVGTRSEEHTSELQSRRNLACRLLLEKTIFYQ